MKTLVLEQEVGKNQTLVVDSALNLTGTVDWTRAMSLVVTREASLLIPRSDGSVVRSTYLTFPRPLVVSLTRYVGTKTRVMHPEDAATRSMILIRDGWCCAYCGRFGDTIDHITPKSRGGKNTWGNLAAACHECNEAKADHTPEEMGWKRPFIPKTLVSRRNEALQQAIYERLEEAVTV